MSNRDETTEDRQQAEPWGRRPLALSVVTFALLIAFAWRKFLGGAHSPFVGDIRHYHHAINAALARAWDEGRLPLWNDHSYFGFPMFADPQTAAWYPGTLLVLALGPHWGYALFLVLHCLLAAVGTLGLMRAHGVAWSAAWASGLMVALSGYFAHEGQHPGLFAILCWIPAWLWTTKALFRRQTAGRVALAATCLATMLFAGTLQVMFGAVILYAFYVLGVTLDAREREGWPSAVRGFSFACISQVLGLCLAAVMLVPAVAHLSLTARSLGMTYDFSSTGSVHPFQILGAFVNLHETSFARVSGLDYAGASFYQGSLALALAVVGLFIGKRYFAIALSVAFASLAILALGRHGWLHPLLFDWFPGAVGGLRGMGRALGPGAVAISILAGLGLQRLGEPGDRSRRLFAVVLSGCLAIHGMAIWRTPGPVSGATLGSLLILIFALYLVLLSLLPRSYIEAMRGFTRLADHFRGDKWLRNGLVVLIALDLVAFGALDDVLDATPPPPEVEAVPDAVPELRAIAEGAFGPADSRIMLHGFGPLNLPMLEGVDGVGGYNPLVMLRYLDLISLINNGRLHKRAPINHFVSGAKPQRFASALFDATSIRYVVSSHSSAERDLRLVERYSDSYFGDLDARLYENESALPRAYLAYRSEVAVDELALASLLGRGFDGRKRSIVEAPGPRLAGATGITAVERRSDRPEALSFDVSTEQPAILVVTDTWYPGWRAWVDGVASPVFRVNALFRGVAIPAGARRVEMRFEPRTFSVGAAISVLGATVIASLGAIAIVERRRSR